MNIDYSINEAKIDNWMDELEQDRKKLFDGLKGSNMTDKIKQCKIENLQAIQSKLRNYKNLLKKEEEIKKNY